MSKEATKALVMAQLYFAARAKRLEADKVSEGLKETETELKGQLMDFLQANGLNSVGDKQRVYALVTKDEPETYDWAALYAHIRSTGEFELLYRRVNPAAVKERWENTVEVPGVRKFPSLTLSVTKAKGAK
jgi:hypothetical protein